MAITIVLSENSFITLSRSPNQWSDSIGQGLSQSFRGTATLFSLLVPMDQNLPIFPVFKVSGIWNAGPRLPSHSSELAAVIPPKNPGATRFVCLSDTHCSHAKLEIPDGDVLLHAGDFCTVGTPEELEDFASWLDTLPHLVKIVIAGNHDAVLDRASFGKHITHQKILQDAAAKEFAQDTGFATLDEAAAKAVLRQKEKELVHILPLRCKERLQRSCTYLENTSVKVGDICIFGCPWVPGAPHWAFAMPRSAPELKAKWDAVPDHVHILLTHSPPAGVTPAPQTNTPTKETDSTKSSSSSSTAVKQMSDMLPDPGCEFLRATSARCHPVVNVCGHIHNFYGVYSASSPVGFFNKKNTPYSIAASYSY
jgi:hypothetical protein